MSDCIFCEVIGGRQLRTLLFEDETFVAIQDIHPQAPVHLLVMPKRHVTDLTDLTQEEFIHLFETIKQLIKTYHIKNYRIVNNGGGAQLVAHVHVHLMGSVDKERQL